jgi:radical SAM-linked protein
MVLIAKFSITGNLRYISHAETLRSFHRACVRAELPLKYSQGFNPHPKINLPCPRSVGIEATDELVVIELNPQNLSHAQKNFLLKIKKDLSQQLPRGCDLISVRCEDEKVTLRPQEVTYLIKVGKKFINDNLRTQIESVLKEEHLPVRRYKNDKRLEYKELDLRPFLMSIDCIDNDRGCLEINIKCKFTQSGTIRIEEILKLLGLDIKKLSEPIRRISIKWN